MADKLTTGLASEAIMARLMSDAEKSERGQKRLETLGRLKTACDDIASGSAVRYAEKVGLDTVPFKVLPRRINSKTVDTYVKARRQLAGSDGDALWPGPRQSTLRADPDLMRYLDARQTEANGFSGKPKPKTARARNVDEIVSKIPDAHDRLLVMSMIEDGREARRKLHLASAAIPKLWAIDIDAVIDGTAAAPACTGGQLSEEDRPTMRQLLLRLTTNEQLRDFNLICDGTRVKMRNGTGAQLVSKKELTLLRTLAGIKTE